MRDHFNGNLGEHFYTLIPPVKDHLFLSHLVPEILGNKVGLIFHQNILFNRFKAFCINFPLTFDPIDAIFHWFYIFLTPHFYKTLDPIASNFISRAEPGYGKFDEVSPPHPPDVYLHNNRYHALVTRVWWVIDDHFLVIPEIQYIACFKNGGLLVCKCHYVKNKVWYERCLFIFLRPDSIHLLFLRPFYIFII